MCGIAFVGTCSCVCVVSVFGWLGRWPSLGKTVTGGSDIIVPINGVVVGFRPIMLLWFDLRSLFDEKISLN